jgi:branched-chain amino acid transport system ATP-binding protein
MTDLNTDTTDLSTPDEESILELVDVRAGYGTIEVLHGVTFTVKRGEVLALLGPNGGGKSTTLKVCAGLLPLTTGDVQLAGRSVSGVSADKLARLGLCTIPEGRGIFPNLSVRENLLMCTHTGAKLADIEAIAYDRFPRLSDRRSQLAGTMSGGEQQMLAMARALATDPAVLLLDELSMGLAPLIVGRLYEIVAHVAQLGVTVLVVEQFARTVLGIADRAAIMLHGRITRIGPPDEIAEELSSAYLGGKGQS